MFGGPLGGREKTGGRAPIEFSATYAVYERYNMHKNAMGFGKLRGV